MSDNFVPPQFSAFGKRFKDLWKKKYDFRSLVKVQIRAPDDLTLTDTAYFDETRINGKFEVKKQLKDKGIDVEAEVEAGEGNKAVLKSTFSKLVDGAKLILSGGYDPESKDALVKNGVHGKAELEYARTNLSGSVALTVGEEPGKERKERETNLGAHVVVAAAAGKAGVSVGGNVKANLENVQNLSDVNFGLQYDKDNLTAGFLSEENGEVLRGSFVYRIPNKSLTFGAEFVSDEFDKLSKPSDPHRKVLNLAVEHELDIATTVKGRVSTAETAAVVLDRRCSPNLSLSFSAQYKLKGYSGARFDKFGLGFTYE